MSERSTTGVPSGPPLTSSTVRFVQGLKRPKNLRPAAADDSGAVHTALSTDGRGMSCSRGTGVAPGGGCPIDGLVGVRGHLDGRPIVLHRLRTGGA